MHAYARGEGGRKISDTRPGHGILVRHPILELGNVVQDPRRGFTKFLVKMVVSLLQRRSHRDLVTNLLFEAHTEIFKRLVLGLQILDSVVQSRDLALLNLSLVFPFDVGISECLKILLEDREFFRPPFFETCELLFHPRGETFLDSFDFS